MKDIHEKDNQLKEELFENLVKQMKMLSIQNKKIQSNYEKK